MRNIVVGFTALMFLFYSQALAAPTANERGKSEPYEYVQAEIREWFTFGDSSWRISFIDTSRNGEGESILEFEDIDALMTLATLRVKPGIYWLTLEGTVGQGDIDSGMTVDTDHTEGTIWSKSESDTDGDISIMGFRVFLRIFPFEEASVSYIDGFVGYQYYRERLHITNGEQVIPDTGPFAGLNSTYEFLWESYPIGVKGNLSLEPEKRSWLYDLSFNGEMSLGLARYRGEGVWNLRAANDDGTCPNNDCFEQDPSFKHEADNGISFIADLGFVYQPIRHISFGVGYQLFYFEAWNGTDTIFLWDGREAQGPLDEVNSFRHGPYVSFSGQF